MSKVLTTFEDYPDFCWLVFEDLISLQDNLKQKTGHYLKIIDLFEKAQRPDLACQARLRLSTLQADDEKWDEAAEGLASTILRYPDEGRLVPDMLKLLDECCKHVKNGGKLLASFYLNFLPKIPTHRGDDVSTYCVETHEHAAKVLREFNETAAADRVDAMRQLLGVRKDA